MKMLIVAGMIALTAVASVPNVHAQDEALENVVSQGELARMMVNLLGLSKFLPSMPTDQEIVSALISNKISPAEGWSFEKPVNRGDLARVLVQALGEADQVADLENPESWIQFLVDQGIPIDTVGQALNPIGPMAVPVVVNKDLVSSTDPLKKPSDTSGHRPDGLIYGSDRLINFVGRLTLPETPRAPVTPY